MAKRTGLPEENSSPALRHAGVTDITQLRVFVAVSETFSFSVTARRLSMTPSTVSRHISDLEERLGALLVSRTTRHLVVTEVGQQFYGRCIHILDEIGLAQAEAEQLNREPKGMMKHRPAAGPRTIGSFSWLGFTGSDAADGKLRCDLVKPWRELHDHAARDHASRPKPHLPVQVSSELRGDERHIRPQMPTRRANPSVIPQASP